MNRRHKKPSSFSSGNNSEISPSQENSQRRAADHDPSEEGQSKKRIYALCGVCGVLHGLFPGYKEDLVALGLVEEMINVRGSNGITLYRVTDRGKHIYERYYNKEVRR